MNKNKGFTLIELLVVIAIIGILSSVVLASLNASRTKAADVVVKSYMSNIRTQSSMWYEDNSGTYNTTGIATSACNSAGTLFADPKITEFITNLSIQSMSTPFCYVNDVGDKWAVSVPSLKGGGSWCVDNSNWIAPGTAGDTGVCA